MMCEERIIDFNEILKRVLLKWRILIVWMIVCAIGLNTYGIMQSINKVKMEIAAIEAAEAAEKETEEIVKVDVAETVIELLSEREIMEVKTAVEAYKAYQNEYKRLLEYSQNSIKMKVNPNKLPTMVVNYNIDNYFEISYPTINKYNNIKDIAEAYCTLIMEGDFYNKIVTELGIEMNPGYIQEVVSADLIGNATLVITVFADTKEVCEKIMEVIDDEITNFTDDLIKIYGEFSVTEQSRTYSEQVNSSLLNEQRNVTSNINNMRTYVNSLTSGWSENQKVYYAELLNSVYGKKNQVDEIEIEVEEIIEESFEKEPSKVEYIHLKYIICGMLLGVAVVCAWVMFAYIFNSKLQMPDDMNSLYGISVMGVLYKEKKSKQKFLSCLDRFILNVLDLEQEVIRNDERLKVLIEEIKLFAARKELETIFITSTASSEDITAFVLQLQKFAGSDVKLLYNANYAVNDGKSFHDMLEADGVIVIEEIAKSRYTDISKLIEKIRIHDTFLLGSIIVD